MYSLVETLSQDCSSLAVFAGGGEITRREMGVNAEQGRKMILLAGSGRSVDAVLAVQNGQQVSDPQLLEIARRGKIVAFDIKERDSSLRDLLHRSLFDEEEE